MRCLVPLLLAAHAMALAAPPPPPLASDPAAPAAPRQHCSPLRPVAPAASEPTPRDWRESNLAVQRAGGWRQYAKEAARAEPARAPCQEVRP